MTTDTGGPPDVHLENNCVTTSIFAMPWASSQGEAFTNTFLCSVILPLKCNLQLSSLLSTTEIKCAMCCMMMHRQGTCSLTYKLLNRWSRVVHALSDQQPSCLERRRDLNSKPCGGHVVACSCPVQPSKRHGIQNKHFIVLARNGPHHDKSNYIRGFCYSPLRRTVP